MRPQIGDLVVIVDETVREGLWGVMLEKRTTLKVHKSFVFQEGRTMMLSEK